MGKKPKSSYHANADIASLKKELGELGKQVNGLQETMADILSETGKTMDAVIGVDTMPCEDCKWYESIHCEKVAKYAIGKPHCFEKR